MIHKTLFFVSIFFSQNLLTGQSCLLLGDTLTRQGQIDSFEILYTGCKIIEGDLGIKGETIFDLSGFASIEIVKGYLTFTQTGIKDFQGLDLLRRIEKGLRLYSNDSLQSFTGLNSLKYVNDLAISNNDHLTGNGNPIMIPYVGGIYISDSDKLKRISDILIIDSLYSSIYLHSNASLLIVDGFLHLDSLLQLDLEYNPLLESIEGMLPVNQIGYLDIRHNEKLANLGGLDSLTAITRFGQISSCPSLTDISALHNLRNVGGNFILNGNLALPNLNGLEKLNSINGYFYLGVNVALNSLEGLRSLNKIDSFFIITASNKILSLQGLNQLDSILGGLYIRNLSKLEDLSAIDSLQHLGGSLTFDGLSSMPALPDFVFPLYLNGNLTIENNASLSSLKGLDSIKFINEELHIIDNPLLDKIDALQDIILDNVDTLIISGNSILSVCNVKSVCQYLSSGKFSSIFENETGCNSVEEIINQCLVHVKTPLDDNSYFAYPNPTLGVVYLDVNLNEILFIRIFDNNGRLLDTLIGDNETLDLSNLSTGLYFVSVHMENCLINYKVLKL